MLRCISTRAHITTEVLVSHANARTTVHGRLLIVPRHQQGWTKAPIAAAMGLSRPCVIEWIARFEAEGKDGLRDRSSRPRRCSRRTPDGVEERIDAVRREQRRGPDWIGAEVGVAARTVSRVRRRHEMPYPRGCDPMTGAVIRASTNATAVRYERERPGELVHVDVKKLGRTPDGGGCRTQGRCEEVGGRGIG